MKSTSSGLPAGSAQATNHGRIPHPGSSMNPAQPPPFESAKPHHTLATWWHLGKQVVTSSIKNYVPSMAAALAYYTVFSMAPLLLIVVSVAGLIFSAEAARGEIQAQLVGFIGENGAAMVQNLLAGMRETNQGRTAVVGLVLLLVGATTVFAELQASMDRIWRVGRRERKRGFHELLRARLLSFGLILVVGLLLVVSLLASAILGAIGSRWETVLGDRQTYIDVGNAVGGFLLVALMFGLVYKFMPRVRVAWGDVWLGALLAALLFTLGKVLISAYIGRSGVTSAHGAAGSLVAILLWVYVSAQMLLFGAEFTHAYAGIFGSRRGESGPESASFSDPPAEVAESNR